jgi:hypothetical protein
MSVYDKIEEFLKKPYAGEDKLEYLKEVALLLSKAPEEDWDALDPEAQDWYILFADGFENNIDNDDWVPPELDGLDEVIAAYTPIVAKPARIRSIKEKTEKEPKPVKAAKEPKVPKTAKEPKTPKTPKVSAPSNSGIMREIILDHFDLTLDCLMDELEKLNVVAKRSSAHIIWYNSLRILEAAVKKGQIVNAAGEVFSITKK